MFCILGIQLDRQAVRPSASFAEALSALHAAKYTGALTVHFAEGQPKAVEFSNPQTVTIRRP